MYIVGVVASSVCGSSAVLVDTVADPISGVEAADEVSAPVYGLMSKRI